MVLHGDRLTNDSQAVKDDARLSLHCFTPLLGGGLGLGASSLAGALAMTSAHAAARRTCPQSLTSIIRAHCDVLDAVYEFWRAWVVLPGARAAFAVQMA